MLIGILGAGQLGRMMAEAGHRLGMQFRFLDPAREISARGLGEHIFADYDDQDALGEFAEGLDLVTYEFENVPAESAEWLATRVPVHPSPAALRISQDRLLEKNHARECGVPVAKYEPLERSSDIDRAVARIGLPAIVKTRRFGYDGKGQRVVREKRLALKAFDDLKAYPVLMEEYVVFDRELSLIAVRDRKGAVACYPLVQNWHRDGILRLSIAPADNVAPELQQKAEKHAKKLMKSLDYVGTLAIEFFEKDGELYFNEMAPRVHNSGHWSIEGAETSQFENHLRAIAGMPLGPTQVKGFAAMVNLIGSIEPMDEVLTLADVYLHDYDKTPREDRKLGHLTVVAESRRRLADHLRRINQQLEANRLREFV